MSLRLRLTLSYTGVLAATLLFVFTLAYVVLSFTLSQQVNQLLSARAQQYTQTLVQLSLTGVDSSGGRPGQFARFAAVAIFGSNPDVYAQLVTTDGSPVVTTPNLQNGLPVDHAIVTKVVRDGQPVGQTMRVGDLVLQVENFAVTMNNQVVLVLQIGKDVSQTQATLRFLREVLVLTGSAGIVVAFAAGWLLARQALRPIERIAQTAEDIGTSQDFGRRVEYKGPADELGRMAATFNDMLEHIQTAYRQIESALNAQRRFVADASHELRTPLTTIRGNLGLLSGDHQVSTEDSREALEDMSSEAERMSRLVANLLTLARADAGLHVAKEPVKLDEVVQSVYRQAKVLSNGVNFCIGGSQPAIVTGNADYLKQLLLILVENALKNTPSGGTVEVSDCVENGLVKLTVRDTGKGIPAEALPNVFERFYQADKSRSSGGTGLGLAIAKWIAEEHEGRIEVESEVGRGTVFTVSLPAAAVPDRVELDSPVQSGSALG